MFCKMQAKHKKAKLPTLTNRCASHFFAHLPSVSQKRSPAGSRYFILIF